MGDDVIRKYIWGLAAVMTAFLGQAALAQDDRPALVEVDPVRVETLSQTMPVIGRFVARQRGNVAAATAGPVVSVLVEVGDRVKQGDPLVALDKEKLSETRNLQAAALDEAKAAVNTARESLNLARQEFKRLERLKGSAAFSKARLDDKRQEVARYSSEVVEAQAAVARAKATLALADIDLDRSTIKAPYNGVVVERQVERGAYVSVGQDIVTLVNDEEMEIEADIPADRISGLTPGRVVQVSLGNGSHYPAAVRAVIPEENALTRTRAVRFIPAFDGEEPLTLAAGQSVTVLAPVGTARKILSVHKDSVLPKGDEDFVFVVEDGHAVQRRVALGEAVGNRFEVLSGLVQGEIVIMRGNERVVPGQAVTYPKPDRSEQEGAKMAPKAGEAGG
ncbi:efflux RND transporter periplasmic adaptor subunit [Aestuariispira ectoiniformans]|uniref:efflux RND transporter periplasmic adaptor subunit n=1 Tax=Aestuariispira ectoiniformans TaxID=2775080 RepID=UPI00223AD2CC|nr:efflux RND transporter periplasmic adaptor subunit [Aestuariispira ectoiniformans]